MLSSVAPTAAAITRVTGPTTLLVDGRALVKFDAAHDPVNHVYLVAYGTQALGPVNGMLVDESGASLTPLFALSDGPMQSGWARIIYSAEQSCFLVSYVKIVGTSHHQKAARFVTVSNNTPSLGPELILDDWIGDSGTATGIAYAAASGKFLVTWSHYLGSFPVSFVVPIDPSGAVGVTQVVSNPGDGESDPELACDPTNRQCLVIGIAWGVQDGSGKSSFWVRFIDDTTGAAVGPILPYVAKWGGLMDPPAIVFTPSAKFLMGIGTGGVVQGIAGDAASGTFGVPFVMIQDTTGTQGVGYGFLSMRLSPAAQTIIATMTSWVGYAAVQELTGAGGRTLNGFDLIPDTPDNPSKPWDTANQFAVPAVNRVTGAFAVFENHYFKAIRVSTYSTGQVSQPPVITKNPVTISAISGAVVSFSASAIGTPAPTVLWQVSADNVNWSNISGGATSVTDGSSGTSTTLVQQVHRIDSGKLYRAVFTSNGLSTIGLAAQVFVSPPALNDMDGDGRSDLLVWRPSDNTWYWALSSSTNLSTPQPAFGSASTGDIPMTGDLDGDGAADIVVWRPLTGTWYWLTSSNGYSIQGQLRFGGLGDAPMMADMDGDGLSDLVVWRPSTGIWYWLTSSSGFTQMRSVGWGGTPGDVPLTADVDGDGKADLVIWRPSEGMWYMLLSTAGYSYATGVRMIQWGAVGDRPLVGDLDGDGRDDLVLWRPSNGTWYWLTSSTGYTYPTSRAVQWGVASVGDIPILADFDGDGRADIIVWRSSTGAWYWLLSSADYSPSNARMVVFGGPGDIPIVR